MKCVFTQAWLDAPYEIQGMSENGELIPDTMPTFRFTEENLTAALEALKKKDFVTLRKLRVPQFELVEGDDNE